MQEIKEIQSPIKEMTVPQYSKYSGISETKIRRMCESGMLEAYKLNDDVKASRWIVKVPKDNVVPYAQYEAVVRENAELKNKLDTLRRLLA